MRIYAIDPGTTESGWVELEGGRLRNCGITENRVLRIASPDMTGVHFAIEWVESFGMPVGKEVFETVAWIGCFEEVAYRAGCVSKHRISRRQAKLHLCHSVRATDANIRQALIDRFGPGKDKAIGLKKTPGPLYNVKSHMWAALAVAITCAETRMAVMSGKVR